MAAERRRNENLKTGLPRAGSEATTTETITVPSALSRRLMAPAGAGHSDRLKRGPQGVSGGSCHAMPFSVQPLN